MDLSWTQIMECVRAVMLYRSDMMMTVMEIVASAITGKRPTGRRGGKPEPARQPTESEVDAFFRAAGIQVEERRG